ncbi:protein MIZU-KUSSEI 1-like [Typha angustifolia]|uniref:protein MIZU-KUSSEI 1-like n=1 Tax=Typha angustifolia TaxID=59011 RepID=UPI003C2CB3F7
MGNPIHPFPSPNEKDEPIELNTTPTTMADTNNGDSSDQPDQPDQPMLQNPTSTPPTATATFSLIEPPRRHGPPPFSRPLRLFRSLCRTFPVFTPKCSRLPSACKPPSSSFNHPSSSDFHHHPFASNSSTFHRASSSSTTRVTGTLFGYRKGRVSLSLQQTPRCLPSLVVELALQTHALLRELGTGMVRVALECEKQHGVRDQGKLLEEPLWTMFCNGKKNGYGVRREATEEDLAVMETLKPVSMGAGVMPGKSETEGPDAEMAYVRAFFEHVVGSKDSETLYMMSPEGGNGPELTIFFVRI